MMKTSNFLLYAAHWKIEVITIYEKLLIEADRLNLVTKEKKLECYDGRLVGNKIAIRKDIVTSTEKACVLAEELGHYHTSTGNIIDQSITENRKQEYHARAWAYNKMIGLTGIINAHKNKCQSIQDTAEYLNVSVPFLKEALSYYKNKYGTQVVIDNYVIFLDSGIGVLELIS